MSTVDKIEDILEGLLTELCKAQKPEFNIFESGKSSSSLREKLDDLFGAATSVAALVQIGDHEQHHAFYFDSDFGIYESKVLGADFVEIPTQNYVKQLEELKERDLEHFEQVENTNYQREKLVETLLSNMSDSRVPNKALNNTMDGSYLDFATIITTLSEVFGMPKVLVNHRDGYTVIDVTLDPDEAELISYTTSEHL